MFMKTMSYQKKNIDTSDDEVIEKSKLKKDKQKAAFKKQEKK